jgi:transcriptional antiterminator NusG
MWHVIWVLTGKEKEFIRRFREIVPCDLYTQVWTPYKVWIKNSGKEKKQMLSKMFPGYVFIDTDSPKAIQQLIKNEQLCMGLLQNDDEFLRVSDEERQIIDFFTSGKGIAGVSLCVIENGQLRAIEGPLKGMEDKVFRLERSKNQAWVKFDNLLGAERRLSFAVEIIEG